MSDQYTPTSICNLAMDAAALDFTIGDISEGTRPAQVCLRRYSDCVSQLLRTAHWTFARKSGPLMLVADASGQTPNVGSIVPLGGFQYAYAPPPDMAKLRYIPLRRISSPPVPADNIVPFDADAPTTTATQPVIREPIIPTRFLIGNDPNYVPQGASNNQPNVSPIGSMVIMSNQREAHAVYTFNATYPNLWDSLFRQAMVAFLAAEIVVPLAKDKKFGMQMRAQNIEIAKEKIREARATSANETWASSDLSVDWMRARASGQPRGYWGGLGSGFGPGAGYLFGGFDGIWWENSSAY